MATVRKREWVSPKGEPRSAWIVRYMDQNGKQRIKTFPGKKTADAYRVKVEGEVARHVHTPDADSATVDKAIGMFLDHMQHRRDRGEIGETYLRSTRGTLRNYTAPVLGGLKLNRLKFTDVERLHQAMLDRGLSQREAVNYLGDFKLVEDYARKRGLTSLRIVSDVLQDLRGVPRRKVRTFTVEQIKGLLAEAGHRPFRFEQRTIDLRRCVIHLAAFSGLRFCEIAGLTMEHVDFDRSVLLVRHNMTKFGEMKGPKTHAGIRDVPMPRAVSDMLRAYVRDHHRANDRNLLFTSKSGKRLSPSVFYTHFWMPLLKRVKLGPPDAHGNSLGLDAPDEHGKRYHFHALRHFAASLLVDRNIGGADVAKILGHSTFDTTLRVYTHSISVEPQRHAAIEAISTPLLEQNTTRMRHEPEQV